MKEGREGGQQQQQRISSSEHPHCRREEGRMGNLRTSNKGIRHVLEQRMDLLRRDELVAALDEVGQDLGHVLLVAGGREGGREGGEKEEDYSLA